MKSTAAILALLVGAASFSAFAAKSITKPSIGTQPITIGTQPINIGTQPSPK